MSTRRLKISLAAALDQEGGVDQGLDLLRTAPPMTAIHALLGLLMHQKEWVRWHAVTLIGIKNAELADQNLAAAREVMRQLMWRMNDESGGIGWGAPESMGEIMARSLPLAAAFARILFSYIDPQANYIEHPPLQRGVLWGIARLAEGFPDHAAPAAAFLIPYLSHTDATLRALAGLALQRIGPPALRPHRARLAADPAPVTLYLRERLHHLTVGQIFT